MDRSDLSDDRTSAALRKALQASEARFRNIIEKNADGVIVVRRDGRICFVNPAAVELLGRSASDLLGGQFGIPLVPTGTTEVDIPLGGGAVRIAELRTVETEWEGTPALLITLHDVTERKRLDEQLRQKADQLLEADRLKDEFLAMLAHELRNPLAPILNAVHIMRLRGDDRVLLEELREMVERQVRVMARLVDDLLDVSRITRGKIRLRMEPVDLLAVVHRGVETTRPMLQARCQSLKLTTPSGPLRLQADSVRLEQILVNLLNNASKYSDDRSEIVLTLTVQSGVAIIEVTDFGIGIAPEMLPRVFELFAQADRSLDRARGGLGIGLTLVRSLVTMHGGTVTCRSDGLGKGSAFVVRLPMVAPAVAVDPPPVVETPPDCSRVFRVLVIDDNINSAESLALIIKLWGHDTRVAHGGPRALEIAAAYRPEIVLLDIGLPEMDGYAVARSLRATPGLEGTLLLAITGYSRDEDRQRSREAGFDHHLVKPLDLDALEALIARFRG
jgi:signal transduction histidine kinase